MKKTKVVASPVSPRGWVIGLCSNPVDPVDRQTDILPITEMVLCFSPCWKALSRTVRKGVGKLWKQL